MSIFKFFDEMKNAGRRKERYCIRKFIIQSINKKRDLMSRFLFILYIISNVLIAYNTIKEMISMAKKKFLNENEEQIWPITRADCVYTEDGKKLLSEDYASKKYVDDAISENGFSGDYNDLENKPSIPSIEGLATEDYVDNEITKLRDEMIVLDEDDLSIDGLIDSTFPSLETEDKTLIGAINEVNENIQNIKPTEEEIEKAVIDKMLMDVFGVVVDEEAN